MRSVRRHPVSRFAIATIALAATAALATACQPEPAATATPEPPASATPTPTLSPSPIETELPDVALPASCEEIYSPAMTAQLEGEVPPLNDPGITMYSSENVAVLELINSGVETLRCTWGMPSEHGLATTIAPLGADQRAEIERALVETGFGCEPLGEGTVCRAEQRGIDLDDHEYARGEEHYLGPDVLVATAWLNVALDGYTEDIVATLWG